MSGGHFDYDQYRIGEMADKIARLIAGNDSDESYNDRCEYQGRGYTAATLAELEAAVRCLRIAEIYAQRIDWLVSCDDGEESFHRRLADDLAKLG